MNARDSILAAGANLSQHPAVSEITHFHSDLVDIRHRLHQIPEIGYEEIDTAQLIADELEACGVDEIHRGLGVTGVVAVIKGKGPVSKGQKHQTIGLRADIDALAMNEDNQFDHRSQRAGMMHGCGHDGHTTMLLGAARYLASSRNFSGTAHLIFQPGEEGLAGAKAMIDDGLFDRFPCDAVFAMHNWPGLPAGEISMQPGPIMAAADAINITVTGVGGHGAHPELVVDPVVVAAHIITAIQSIVSRNVNPIHSAVISVCAVQAGDMGAFSVMPHEAKLVGTVRTFNAQTQDRIEARLGELVTSVAKGLGATAELKYSRIYPATINSVDEAEFAADVARALVGDDKMKASMDPSMGAEDFSFMLEQRPGAYFRVGQGGEPGGCFLHNSRYDFNDKILPLGAGLYASLVEKWLPIGES